MHESRVAPHMEGLVSPEVVTLLGRSGDRNDIFRNHDRSASQNYTGSHPMPLFSTVPSTVTSDWLSGLATATVLSERSGPLPRIRWMGEGVIDSWFLT